MAGKRARGRVRIDAFAKINLNLRVLGLRPDGYHDLRTTFQTIAIHDTLTLTKVDGPFEIVCSDAACPVDRTNLIWRAADEIWRAARKRGALCGVRVRLHKRVPMQAGLGGGSSDAAAALRAFQTLWRVRMSGERLRRMAAKLGADVPFFLQGGTAIGIHRGDVLERRPDAAACWVVLVLPTFGVSTKEAFAWWDAVRSKSVGRPVLDLRERDGASASGAGVGPRASKNNRPPRELEIVNDLEGPVTARHPEIATIVAALTSAGATQAAMSGSGSAVFGLFETKRAASAAAAQLKDPSRRTLVTRTVGRADFQRRSRPRST